MIGANDPKQSLWMTTTDAPRETHDMSRSIYPFVLKCTGRTCNADPVIGGDVVASPWYVYIFLNKFVQYVYSLIFCFQM